MAGENASAQPGGREPAPGSLAVVQAFINTHYDLVREHGADVLASPEALREWLIERGLLAERVTVSPGNLRRALDLREQLRALATHDGTPTGFERLNEIASGAPVEVRFSARRAYFSPASGAGVAGALGALLAIVGEALADGSWSRLKVCPGRDCGWAFYDHSRNRTGRWCSMSVCGGREKARAHYQRRRGNAPR